MDLNPTSDGNHINRALICLLDGVYDQAMRSSEPCQDDRQRILQDLTLLEPLYRTLGQCIQRHVTEKRQQLNSQAPINRLPNELLIKIFTLTLTSDHNEHALTPHYIIGLSLVSKDWSRIVFKTPSLWGQISSRYSERENRVAILRSKGYPLKVYYSDEDVEGDDYRTLLIRSAIREAHRWQSAIFCLKYDSSLLLLRGAVSLSAPLLEELEIDCGDVPADILEGENIDLFSGGADHLRHLSLSYFQILWSSPLLSRLETLTIMGSPIVPSPTASELTDILRRCPKLYKFAMITIDEIRVLGDARSEVGIAYLPALKSFTLHLRNPEAFNRILSSVRIPECTMFSLRCSRATRNIFSDETSHITTALLSAIRSTPNISLSLSLSELNLTGRRTEDDPGIDITLNGDSPWELLASIIEPSVPWPPIDAYISCNELPYLQVTDLLGRIPSITTVHLTGNSDQYIAYLSYPTLNDCTYEWVLPNLRELTLKDCPQNNSQVLTDLLRNLQARAVMNQGDGVQKGLRMKLEKLHVVMMNHHGYPMTRPFYVALRQRRGNGWDGNMID
ncbi:hypothetical protein FRB93_006227 [Tulasnella sp. JGI-2019a]|nr:hypothetical protein FRB93_006227 [Tulasnella sp. JGI-2019a]